MLNELNYFQYNDDDFMGERNGFMIENDFNDGYDQHSAFSTNTTMSSLKSIDKSSFSYQKYSEEDENQNNKNNYKEIQMICKPILQDSQLGINLFTGMQITGDGVVRIFGTIFAVYFGFNQQQVILVEDLPQSGIVNLRNGGRTSHYKHTFQQAYKYIEQIPNIDTQLAIRQMQQVSYNVDITRMHLQNRKVKASYQYQLKDLEFFQFQKMCMEFLEKMNAQMPNQMYAYNITRICLDEIDLEISNYGYSKAYLDLLGIDSATLSQIILRNKQIDLIPKKQDITTLGLGQMENHCNKQLETTFSSEIVTFDGFPLKITQKTRQYGSLFSQQTIYDGKYEYHFVVNEIDVDLYDLEQLINYRQRLAFSKNLSIDDLLKKELSYLFEDVEYSINAQSFVEKYYPESIQRLKKKKEVIQVEKQCKYRFINQ